MNQEISTKHLILQGLNDLGLVLWVITCFAAYGLFTHDGTKHPDTTKMLIGVIPFFAVFFVYIWFVYLKIKDWIESKMPSISNYSRKIEFEGFTWYTHDKDGNLLEPSSEEYYPKDISDLAEPEKKGDTNSAESSAKSDE